MATPNDTTSIWGNVAQWAGATVTFMAVMVALFGEWARARLFKPALELSYPAQNGETSDHGPPEHVKSRYYHVRVSNRERWPTARDVRVLMIRLEDVGPDGEPRSIWAHDDGLPLEWRYPQIRPQLLNIGPPADANLCSVMQTGLLRLHPVVVPYDLEDRLHYKQDTVVFVTLQARSNETESEILCLRISWDGKWDPGASEMAGHLAVKPVSRTGD